MLEVINKNKVLVAIGLISLAVIYNQLSVTNQPTIIIVNNEGGNDSGGVDLPPQSTIDKFLKLIRGSDTQSGETRNS